MSSSALSKRKGFLVLGLIAVLITLLVGFFLWNGIQSDSVQTAHEHIHRWQPILASMRWMMIGGLALGWPSLCRWLAQSGRVSNDKAQQLTTSRWRLVGWLVVIEMIIGQSLLVKLMTIMAGKPG